MLSEQYFSIEGARLHGASSGGATSPIVFLHGVTRTWQDFVTFLPPFALRWPVLAVDLRGHGRSDRAAGAGHGAAGGGYRVTDYADDVVDLLSRHVAGRVVLYGHSLGSLIALVVAARLPDRVRALVLEDPPLDLLGERIKQSLYYDLFAGYRDLLRQGAPAGELMARLADLLISVPGMAPGQKRKARLGDTRDPASLRYLTHCLEQLDPRVLEPLVDGLWTAGLDLPALLGEVRCPTLILQGNPALGGMCGDDEAAAWRAALHDCTAIKLEQVGHLIHVLATDEATRLTMTFLESLAGE